MRMLNRGGNAVDAGVAATFAAAVSEISHFGLGGEVPIIIYLARSWRGRRDQWAGSCSCRRVRRPVPTDWQDSDQWAVGRDRARSSRRADDCPRRVRHAVARRDAGSGDFPGRWVPLVRLSHAVPVARARSPAPVPERRPSLSERARANGPGRGKPLSPTGSRADASRSRRGGEAASLPGPQGRDLCGSGPFLSRRYRSADHEGGTGCGRIDERGRPGRVPRRRRAAHPRDLHDSPRAI